MMKKIISLIGLGLILFPGLLFAVQVTELQDFSSPRVATWQFVNFSKTVIADTSTVGGWFKISSSGIFDDYTNGVSTGSGLFRHLPKGDYVFETCLRQATWGVSGNFSVMLRSVLYPSADWTAVICSNHHADMYLFNKVDGPYQDQVYRYPGSGPVFIKIERRDTLTNVYASGDRISWQAIGRPLTPKYKYGYVGIIDSYGDGLTEFDFTSITYNDSGSAAQTPLTRRNSLRPSISSGNRVLFVNVPPFSPNRCVMGVYDLKGAVVYHTILNSGSHRILLPGTTVPSGMYLVRLQYADTYVVQQVTIPSSVSFSLDTFSR
jgi:hypothetical protein